MDKSEWTVSCLQSLMPPATLGNIFEEQVRGGIV